MTNQLPSGTIDNYKDFILSTARDISSVQNRAQLDKMLKGALSSAIGFRHSTVFVLNDDGSEIANFLENYSNTSNKYQEPTFTTKILFDSKAGDATFHKQYFDLDDLIQKGDFTAFLNNSNAAESFFLFPFQLLMGREVIGIWLILFEKADKEPEVSTALCQVIASNLTFAILNIKAQETIKKNKKEREIIQALNIDFATIREKQDLLRIIHFKLRSIFNFRHHWIATVNEDQLTMSAFMQDTESKTKLHPKYKHVTYAKYTIADKIFNRVILAGEPQVFDLEKILAKGTLPEYLQINYESGIRKVVMQSLEIAGKFIGVWALCLGEGDEVDNNYISLVKDIANQFSIAVGNIIANETIQSGRAEQELLLKLSFDMTSVKNRDDLLKTIKLNLKKIFNFKHLTILTINDGDHTPEIFLSTDPSYKYDDGYFNKVAGAEGVVSFYMDEITSENHPGSIQHTSGIGKRIGIALRKENRNIGALYIDLEDNIEHTEHELELIKGVSYQLSTAVSNIIVNENILKREHERDLLLSLNMDIAAVRSNSELLKVISKRLKYLLKFSHTIIATINEDATVSRFLPDPEHHGATHARFPIQDDIFDKCILTPEPLIFNLEELTASGNGDLPLYLKINYESGLKNAVIIRFSKGDDVFGFWGLLFDHDIVFDKARRNLIKGISHQISIVVSNLSANERINKQLTEINQYKGQLADQTSDLEEEVGITQNYGDIVGESLAIKKTFKLISQVAMSDSTVLIEGETGTGKELIARAIHNNSPRKDKLIVKVNCAALPPNLIESELFGHERGSFTGATEQRIGKFELANNSTLFLDEIGEMPLDLQVKLLRALQEKEIERVGGNKTLKVNVRVVAATNRDLVKEVAEGRFRSDLYYRLNVFPISLPPLRNRKEDIPLLTSYFVRRFAKQAGREINTFSDIAMQHMIQYDWPGNVRELEHVIERCVLLSSGDAIKFAHLLPSSRQAPPDQVAVETTLKTIDENERDHILRILKFCSGKIAGNGGAAQILGVPPGTLYSKLKKLGIKREHSV